MRVRDGNDVLGIEEHEVDVVVVGSGGGGAPAALELTRAGLDVMILEAGPYLKNEQLTQRPLDTVRRIYVDKGGQQTVDGGVQILQGSVVGGSTYVNAEACFRVPDRVLAEWASEHGVEGLGPEELGPVFDEVLERINASTDGGRSTDGAKRVLPGFAKVGLEAKPLVRNTKGCRGCNYCFFGCAYGCKQSMDQSYLPDATEGGARLVSNARVSEIRMEGRRARGVVARTAHGTLEVRARAVVLACGAIATPLMLADHGLGGTDVGQNLFVHPIGAPMGVFEDEAPPGSGAVGAFADDLADQGVLFETFSMPRDFFAVFVPGMGEAHRRLVRELPRISGVGVIARDSGAKGTVTRDKKGRKRITWKMDATTEAKLRLGFRKVVDLLFAAGAKEVLAPALDVISIGPDDDRSIVDRVALGPADVQFLSYHPQGTARMGSVTDDRGAVRDTEGLYVMDTSLFPTPVGVNTQVPVMAVSTLLARRLAERLS